MNNVSLNFMLPGFRTLLTLNNVDLLDYEKIHGLDPGSYGGDEGDVTKIREALKEIAES